MPENNQILSVEGQLIGMPLAGPESFSQQQLDYLKRALGVDETVLYESNTAVAQGGTFDFSETPENFEYIRVYVVHGATALTWEQILEYPGDAIRYDVVMFACDQENSLLMDKFYFSRNGKTVTVGVRKRHTISTSTPTTGTLSNPAFFKKVVGIHRIAGGN